MQMRLCRCDMGVVTLKEKVLLDDLTGIRMEGSGGLHIVADGEVKLEGQEVNLNGNRGVTIYEGKAVPDLEKLLDTEEGALLPEVTVTAAGKVELTTEEGENTVQNRGEKVTYYLAWGHADLSHPSNRYRDEPEQKNYDWAQWRLNIAAGMVVVGSVTILGAVVAGAAAGAGLIDAGNVSAGSAAASVGGAVFLTGSLYVAEQAVSDAVSGRLGDTEKYVRKALSGSVVGFLTGASGLMMQGASLGKVLSLGFGEGFLGSTAAQGLLNEDGEINWALAIGDGMFSAVMAGLVWKKDVAWRKEVKTDEAVAGNMVLRSDPYTYFDNIKNRIDVDDNGFFDIVAHGGNYKVQIEINGKAQPVDHRFIGNMLLHSDAYNGQPIRLLSCNTGRLADGFAQNLANFMNVEVCAPTKYIWAYPNGKHLVAEGIEINGKLVMDEFDKGIMKIFYPGGGTRNKLYLLH